MSLEIRGAAEMKRLAAELAAASRALMPDLVKAGAEEVRPLRADIPRSARSTLPRSGGLAAAVARSTVTITLFGNGVRVLTVGPYDLKSIDAGTVHHQTYGRGPIIAQRVAPGFWTKPTTAIGPKIRAGLDRALQRNADRVR